MGMSQDEARTPTNFIRNIIDEDLKNGKNGAAVVTRFPPEPNGYLHIGHAKSICLNFGLARDYADAPGGARCHLRFDDTNPVKEEQEFIDAIKEDLQWLGFDWGKHEYYASDYFQLLYDYAVQLIQDGKAYVDDQTAEEMRENRGTLTEAGTNSPYRDRPIEENLDLFERMKNGEFPDGSRVLRAKIDMASPNMNLRDPAMYRILHAHHHRTGDKWCIYPMYDWAHGQSDSKEGITHSICTLEFEAHRPLYDWFCENLKIHHPQQIEFSRLNLSYTVMSKRKLLQLVQDGHVAGWDDPRMPTVHGLRRRGYTAAAIRHFIESHGVGKADSRIDVSVLEQSLRDDLDKTAIRRMAVLDPLKVVITNYPEDEEEWFEPSNHPKDPEMGKRKVPFSRELYIERDDFMLDAPKKFFRLSIGKEVRFRSAYWVTCHEAITDEYGNVVELHCTVDPETRGAKNPSDGRKVKGTIHWVSAKHAVKAEVRVYDRLFRTDNPEKGDFLEDLNPDSLEVKEAFVEPALAEAQREDRFQFERTGYFVADRFDHSKKSPVFNKAVGLRDTWAKIS